ncbi:MAG: hypothetical protein CMH64_00435 [Nanoarchaeota archaeon]|nr:hypothetical protein [Nanoarchaeota archaeon]|tara:strand:+ start:1513 stop:1740 length:228 start_codon:yes stop_codon:yes gene_type:complete
MEFWFKRKKYGWGWRPSSKEGWLVTGVYIILIIFLANYFTKRDQISLLFETFIVLTLIFIVIAWKTGEKPKWNWG